MSLRGKTLTETNANFDKVAKVPGGGAAAHRSSLSGAPLTYFRTRASSRGGDELHADVFAYAARRSRSVSKSPKELGGENYVFWAGREVTRISTTPT